MVEALWLGPGSLSPYPNLIGLYSLGHYASPRRARLGPILVLPAVLAYFAPEDGSSVAAPVSVLFIWLLAWAAGYSTARRREWMESRRRLMPWPDARREIIRHTHAFLRIRRNGRSARPPSGCTASAVRGPQAGNVGQRGPGRLPCLSNGVQGGGKAATEANILPP